MNAPMLFDQVQRTIQSGGSGNLTLDIVSVVVVAAVGAGQIWAIWFGIRQMQRASAERDRQLRKDSAERDWQFQQQAAESERRHQEMMQSLAAERDQNREDHRAVMRALEALIERTAPPPREAAG